MAAQGMWFGIFAAVLLCLATAIAYAELSKLYPGAGSSYFFAEQAFLSKDGIARSSPVSAKFTVGWASHLYYWGYPGLMVGVTALLVGYVMGQVWPDTFNAGGAEPALHDRLLRRLFFRRGLHRLPRRHRAARRSTRPST